MIEHHCKKCGEWKPRAFFLADMTCPSGRRGTCRECVNKQNRARRKLHRDTAKATTPIAPRTAEATRNHIARELNGTVQTYWHIAEPSPRFGVAMIGGGL